MESIMSADLNTLPHMDCAEVVNQQWEKRLFYSKILLERYHYEKTIVHRYKALVAVRGSEKVFYPHKQFLALADITLVEQLPSIAK